MGKIKAVTRKTVTYKDFRGNERMLKENTAIDVVVLKKGMSYNDGKGMKSVQTHDQYLGMFKQGSVILLQDEFKTID